MKEQHQPIACTRCRSESHLSTMISGEVGGSPQAVYECPECGHIETLEASLMPMPPTVGPDRHWGS
jgi:hypothetical protein